MSFKNKVVIVTGASSGIGAAVAVGFSAEGARVVMVGRNENKLAAIAARCNNPLVVKGDVSNDDDVRRIINQTNEHFGQIDILVNNAGITNCENFVSGKIIEAYDKIMPVNLRAVVLLTSLATPYLIKTKGNVINISSIVGQLPSDPSSGLSMYCVSKAALNHFGLCAAAELAPHGVRVNTVSPGPVVTDVLENTNFPTADWDDFKKYTALNRVSEPQEIADLVMFIASDKAKAITGSNQFDTDDHWNGFNNKVVIVTEASSGIDGHGIQRGRHQSGDDCLHLQLYRDPKDRYKKGQTKASLSLQHFLGFESGFTLDKESNTIAIICQDVTVVLAFETRERLISWQVKVGGQLGSSKEFLVIIGGGGSRKLVAGPARLHLQGRRFALTSGVPPRVLGLWELAHLRRYGVVEGRFCFEGGSHCGKGEGLHMLITDQAQDITDAFDQAAQGNVQSRTSTSRNSERGTKSRPSTRLSDFNPVEQSIQDTASALYEENYFGEDCSETSPFWPSAERRELNKNEYRPDIEVNVKPPWSEADHVTLERCNSCLTKLGSISRCSTVALKTEANFNPAWTMEALNESGSESSSNCTDYLTPKLLEKKQDSCRCKNQPPKRPPKPPNLDQKTQQSCKCILSDDIYPNSNPKVGPYENYDVPKVTYTKETQSEYYDTPKRIKKALVDDLFQVTKSSTPDSLVLKKKCGCILKFASKKKPVIVECDESLPPVDCPCQKVTSWANNLISLPYCKRSTNKENNDSDLFNTNQIDDTAIYATVDVSRKTNRQSTLTDQEKNNESTTDTHCTNYQNLGPGEDKEFEGPYANYENLEFALSLEYYENAKDLLKKAGVTQSELDALSSNLDLTGTALPRPKPRLCLKCGHCKLNTHDRNKSDEYLLMEPPNEVTSNLVKRTIGNNPGYTPMSPNPNWSQSLRHPVTKVYRPEIEKSFSIPTLNGSRGYNISSDITKEGSQKRSCSVDSARLLEDLKEFDSSIGSHATSSSMETLRNLALENRLSSTSDNDRECYECCKSSGSDNKTSEESSCKDIPHLRNKHIDNAAIKRSSSVPCKGGNRDSSSSNDSGVSSCSLKHGGGEFQEFEMPLTSMQSRYHYMVHKRLRGNLSGSIHSSLPRKSKSSDPLRDQPMQLYKSNVSAKSSSAEAEVPVLPPKQFKGVLDTHSTSSGTSDMSDYIETLSLTSSHSSSDAPSGIRLSRQPTNTLRPRSGKEYHNLDPILTSMYKNGKDLSNYTNLP